MPNPDQLRAEARELYAQARQIDDQDQRLTVVSRALELEMAAEAQIIWNRPGGERKQRTSR